MNRYTSMMQKQQQQQSGQMPPPAATSGPSADASKKPPPTASKKNANMKIDEGMLAVVTELDVMVEKRHDEEMVVLTVDNRMTSDVLPYQLILEMEEASDEQMRDNALLTSGKANVLSETKVKARRGRKVAAPAEVADPNVRLWSRDNIIDEEAVLRALETTLAHQPLDSIRITEVDMRALEMVSKAVQSHLRDVLEQALYNAEQQSSAAAKHAFSCIDSSLAAAETSQQVEGVLRNLGMCFGQDVLGRVLREEADCCGTLLAGRERNDLLASISSSSGGQSLTVSSSYNSSASSSSSSSSSKKRKLDSGDSPAAQQDRTVSRDALAAEYALEDSDSAEYKEQLARLGTRRQQLLLRVGAEGSPFASDESAASTLSGEALRLAMRRSLRGGLATDGAFFRARLGLAARTAALTEG